mmetsp:Transcript_35241/g.80459  ORF Transcript_35241/g.80459 Transcript_35241/m.80459 type:complete len:88 (-) Transcript_35241:340-603(-)
MALYWSAVEWGELHLAEYHTHRNGEGKRTNPWACAQETSTPLTQGSAQEIRAQAASKPTRQRMSLGALKNDLAPGGNSWKCQVGWKC